MWLSLNLTETDQWRVRYDCIEGHWPAAENSENRTMVRTTSGREAVVLHSQKELDDALEMSRVTARRRMMQDMRPPAPETPEPLPPLDIPNQ